MATSSSDSLTTPLEGFKTLIDAWRSGRPIVPLFGAGISAGAGIPLTQPMIDYLAKVHWYFSSKEKLPRPNLLEPRETAAKLLNEGRWPERHWLNHEVLGELMYADENTTRSWFQRPDDQPPLYDHPVVNHVIYELELHTQPDRWLVLLQELCDGKQELKDQFFARLETNRRPTTAHQLAAFLTSLMGWQLILTTNFDTLLEKALRSQSLDPTIYELPEHGKVPDPQLIRDHFSLVKLNGGAHGRLMSESLKYSLPSPDLNHLLKFFPENPLLLVLGYAGTERRGMSLIEALVLKDHAQAADPRVLWIHRQGLSTRVEKLQAAHQGRVKTLHYRNGGRFLQELYCRIANSHPVSETHYRAFPLGGPKTSKPDSDPHDSKVVVFHSEEAGSGTSTALAEAVDGLADNKHFEVIWCDLETFATLDGLVTYLHNRFRRLDPDLPPFAFMQTAGDSLSVLKPSADSRIAYLVEAMQRGKYVLAIDSLGEFGTSFDAYVSANAADSNDVSRIREEVERLKAFLLALIEAITNQGEFSPSRLFLACTPLMAPGVSYGDFLKQAQGHRANLVHIEARRDQMVSKIAAALRMEAARFSGKSLSEIVDLMWDHLAQHDLPRLWTLALAACFRRRRDLVILRRLLFNVLCRHHGTPQELIKAVHGFAASTSNIGHKERSKIDEFLEGEGLEPFLVHQEGGFYWMHGALRDALYAKFRAQVGPAKLADIHDVLAGYYYADLFRPSNDPSALFEYVFHRLLSLQCAEEKQRLHRLHDLTVVFKRERDHLLREAHAGMLRRCLGRCRDIALPTRKESEPLDSTKEELRVMLEEMEAEAYRQASRFDWCTELRRKQTEDGLAAFLRELTGDSSTVRGVVARLVTGSVEDIDEALTTILIAIFSQKDKLQAVVPKHAEQLLRLCDHVIEIATCRFEIGEVGQAQRLLRLVRAACRFALGDPNGAEKVLAVLPKSIPLDEATARQLLSELYWQLKEGVPRALKSQLDDLRVRCAFRLMGANLGAINPWSEGEDPDRESLLKEAVDEFHEAQSVLQEYTGWLDRHHDHYVCFVSTLGARAAYLSPNDVNSRKWALAYQYLDAARAAIRRPTRGSDFSSLGIISLYHAECLMLHARQDLTDKVDGAEASAKAKQDRARTSLKQAQSFLARGRLQVWAWTWLRILEARLELDGLAGLEQNDPAREATIKAGLIAVRIGLDSCRQCRRHENELRDLYRGFFQVFRNLPENASLLPSQFVEDKWLPLKREAGLASFDDTDLIDPEIAGSSREKPTSGAAEARPPGTPPLVKK